MSFMQDQIDQIFKDAAKPQPGVGSGGSLTGEAYNVIITDSSAFSLTMDSGARNSIQWLATKDRLLIGTTGGEWSLSTYANKGLTPTDYNLRPETVWGSKDVQPLVLHEAVLFVDFVGKRLRELIWDGEQGRYRSPDLTVLAEHITNSGGITSMAYQRNPDSIIWATLSNGELISCSYDKIQDVIAWAKHPIFKGSALDATDGSQYVPNASYPLLQSATDQTDLGLTQTTAISSVSALQLMSSDVTGNYYLTGNIDASETSGWNGGAGFAPIVGFTGTFEGNGYTISNLTISRSGTDNVGLFANVDGAVQIANVTLADCNIIGKDKTGALIGYLNITTGSAAVKVQNCHSSGSVTGTTDTGGLVGHSFLDNTPATVTIVDCSSSCTIVNSGGYSGGLMGEIRGYDASHLSYVMNSFATGSVTSSSGQGGGLIGGTSKGVTITDSYATGNVTCTSSGGGFIGIRSDAITISRCYATGNVTGSVTSNFGGFTSRLTVGDVVTDCYATGNVTVPDGSFAGGFVGSGGSVTITNCYSTGATSVISGSTTNIGAFFGSASGTEVLTSCYFDSDTSGFSADDAATAKTTAQMYLEATFVDWDFDDIWEFPALVTWEDTYTFGFDSVTVIPSTNEDEIWVTITRVINGALARTIERMKPRDWGSDQEDCFFVDSGLTYDSTATTSFSGLDHLEGESVAILGDGAVFPSQTVSGGAVTLDDPVSVCHIGLPYTYKLKPMRADLNTGRGTTKGTIKKVARAVVSFYKTLNAKHSDGTTSRDIPWRETSAEYTTPPDLFTGDKVIVPDGGFSAEDPFEITGSDPLPCTVRAIVPRTDIVGD